MQVLDFANFFVTIEIMFSALASKISGLFKSVTGRGVISDSALTKFCDEMRNNLIDSDCALALADYIRQKIFEEAKKLKISSSIDPEKILLQITYNVLKGILGDEKVELAPKGKPPQVVMFIGLQGSGKTTSVAKYGFFIKKKLKKEVLVASVDCYRPAAMEQLEELSKNAKIKFYRPEGNNAVSMAQDAFNQARRQGFELLVLDTAGRSEANEELMKEIEAIKNSLSINYTVLVVDSMMGQAVLSLAQVFQTRFGINGIIATKFDSDSRGGAILSARWVTGVPILFVGTGERIDDLEPFIPSRMASRILGQGDLETLFEKASEAINHKTGEEMTKKLLKGEFTFEDFLAQLEMVSKMGSFTRLLGLIPGLSQYSNLLKEDEVNSKLKKIKAVINSMTRTEKLKPEILNESRLMRVSKGSGVSFEETKNFVNQFLQMKKMLPQISKFKGVNPQALMNMMRKF
ncbi:MAG: signal recognition particle receptor subunit alpha [Deltaproteobacteria bacterium]|nr:signal recognition particle receptor subunit alpha [Deltaproteobacteria bacterium]